MKICPRCKVRKDILDFHKDSRKKDGLRTYCKLCVKLIADENSTSLKSYRKSYYKKNKVKIDNMQKERTAKYPETNTAINRKSRLKYYYGITIDDFDALVLKQNGCCAICGEHQSNLKTVLYVDHDHETGEIRGLLCRNCNLGIGYLMDNTELLQSAIKYLSTKKG